MILARASGGWSSPKENEAEKDAPKAQLYDMAADIGEQNNLYMQKPELSQKLLKQLTSDIENGRSTDGPDSQNDVEEIVLWKTENKKPKSK